MTESVGARTTARLGILAAINDLPLSAAQALLREIADEFNTPMPEPIAVHQPGRSHRRSEARHRTD